MGRSFSQKEEVRSAFKMLTGKPTGKKPFGRYRHRRGENIRMDLKETRNWVDSAQDRDKTSGFLKIMELVKTAEENLGRPRRRWRVIL